MIQDLDPALANAPVFTVFRHDELLGNFKGNKGHDGAGDYIDFKYPNKIIVGDIIVDVAGNEFVVSGIKIPKSIGGLSAERYYKVYYKKSDKQENQHITNVVNVNNPINSPIYVQQNTAPAALLAEFKNNIDQCDNADKAILQELYAMVLDIYNGKKSIKKSGLSKFRDAITKYAPIAISLGQLLCQLLIH